MLRVHRLFAFCTVKLIPKSYKASLFSSGGFCFLPTKRPLNLKTGWSEEVIKNILPCTSSIFSSSAAVFDSIAVSYCNALPANKQTGKRRVEDSWLELILPFSDSHALREVFVRADNISVRYGKLFELLDAVAADVAYRHNRDKDRDKDKGKEGQPKQLTIVTASVDGMRAFSNILIDEDLKLQGHLTYVGASSMEITINMFAVSSSSSSSSSLPSSQFVERLVGSTQFIMVARDPVTNAAARVPGLDTPTIESVG